MIFLCVFCIRTNMSLKTDRLLEAKFTKWIIGLVLTLITAVIVGRATNLINPLFNGPEEYKVYVVGGNANRSEDFAAHFWDTFESSWSDVKIHGKPVTTEYKEDRWNEETAAEIARKISSSKDAIMVVGHFSSSTSKVALKAYMNADPPIPVLLTTETNPDLIPEELRSNHEIVKKLPIYRLWPTDIQQANSIAKYSAASKSENVWVVEDHWTNPLYSHFLAEQVVAGLQSQKLLGVNVVLWSLNENLLSKQTLLDLGIDSIIFVGVATNALIFVSQINQLYCKDKGQPDCPGKPKMFLTDAALELEVIQNSISAFEGIYFTHPELVTCKPIGENKNSTTLLRIDYIAGDAALIAKQIIKEAEKYIKPPLYRKILGIQSVEDIRKAIIVAMNNSKFQDEDNPGKHFNRVPRPNETDTVQYHFDKEGINKDASFQLWQVKKGQFNLVEEKDNTLETKICISPKADSSGAGVATH